MINLNWQNHQLKYVFFVSNYIIYLISSSVKLKSNKSIFSFILFKCVVFGIIIISFYNKYFNAIYAVDLLCFYAIYLRVSLLNILFLPKTSGLQA